MNEQNMAYVLEVLTLLDTEEDHEGVFWRVEGGVVRFLVNCNDQFYWGCADCEEITPDNLPVLRQCYADLAATGIPAAKAYALLLFCARVRGLRLQGCCYPKAEHGLDGLWPLFDACGPKRDIDLANPYTHPVDGGKYAYTDEGRAEKGE